MPKRITSFIINSIDASWHSGFGVLSDGRLIILSRKEKFILYLDGNELTVLDSMHTATV